MFGKRKARKAAEAYESELTRWQEEHDDLVATLELARTGKGGESPTVLLKGGESVFLIAEGVRLLAMRRNAGHLEGHSQGLSVPVGAIKGHSVRYRVGAGTGHYVPGPAELTEIDRGTMTITSERVIFTGRAKAVECAFAKLVAVERREGVLSLAVSNRQTPTLIFYGEPFDGIVGRRLSVAVARHEGRAEEVVQDLEKATAQHLAERPAAPPSTPSFKRGASAA